MSKALLERLASVMNHGDAKGTGCDISREQTCKRFHFGSLVGWSFGLVGSAPGTGKNPETLRDTLQRLPVGSVDWCDSLPTGLIFSCRGTKEREPVVPSFSCLTLYSMLIPSDSKKCEDPASRGQLLNRHKVGARLQIASTPAARPLLTHMSAE